MLKGLRRTILILNFFVLAACTPSQTSNSVVKELPKPSLTKPMALARDAARVWISGHSLTGKPMPEYLLKVSHSLEQALQLNHQIVNGSSIKDRSRGRPPLSDWAGYRLGENREGAGLDIIQELRSPKTVTGGYFDTLIITELHGLAGSLIWDDTIAALLHYHNQVIAANPLAQTYLFEPWSNIRDIHDPSDWIHYEKAASPMWTCVATRVNASLNAKGRTDRIYTIPVGRALARLIERATSEQGLPGISQLHASDTVKGLFLDQVHLTAMGSYFVALVNYAALFQRTPVGAYAPPDISSQAARSLQEVAWEVIAQDLAQPTVLSLPECQVHFQHHFCKVFWDQWAQRDKGLWAQWKTRRHAAQCMDRFSQASSLNPLYFDPAVDDLLWWPTQH